MQAVRALLGLIFGAALGLIAGLVIYMVARETVLPTSLWSSDAVMWAIIAVAMALLGWIGARHGWRRDRSSGRALRAMVGFGIGMLAGGLAAAVISIAAAYLFEISQMEGAYAMSVVFTLLPLAAVAGGIAGAIIALKRGGWSERPPTAWGRGGPSPDEAP